MTDFPLADRLVRPEPEAKTTREIFLAKKREEQRRYNEKDLERQNTESLGRWWSQIADSMLDQALAAAWRDPSLTRKTKPLPDDNSVIPGLFVLGLGKLGGFDLNFSSDCDLVAFYDPKLVPVLPFEGKTDVCSRVLRTLNKLLDGHKTGPFAWRLDWRLRPDPSVTDLAMSTDAGLDYFFFRSPPWRRLAMMKARVVGGDKAAGEAFLTELHPFIWRRSLDFRAIDEIAMLKGKIRDEHPELKSERSQEAPLDAANGFHLKLGRGGIREIEFLVNAQQLVWGGRQPELQTTHTLTALRLLVEQERAEAELEQAYLLYRALENRVQLWADGHEHKLPTDPERQNWLAKRSGFSDWQALCDQVVAYREQVALAFDAVFQEQDQDQPKIESEINYLEAWQHGFQLYGLPYGASQSIMSLGNTMARVCLSSPDPEAAANAMHEFLAHLGPSAQSYLRLFAEKPELVRKVIEPLARSTAMATLLHQSPYVVDGLIASNGEVEDVPDLEVGRDFVLAAPTYERQLGALRAFVNEQLYLAYLAVFEARRSTRWANGYLTALAEQALHLGAEILCRDMALERLPFSIIGMGKIATGAMMPLSDLDLIFVVPDETDFEAANRVARRFIALLDAPMKEGRAYPTDTRLRPSGRSGPPTVSLRSFASYHQTYAHTWEHLALVTSRVVMDDPGIGEAIEATRTHVLARHRDRDQLVKDGAKMLFRLREARYTDPVHSAEIKLRPGGLMEAEFLSNALILMGRDPEISGFASLQAAQFMARLYGKDWQQRSDIKFDEELFKQIEGQVQELLIEPSKLDAQSWRSHKDAPVLWTEPG